MAKVAIFISDVHLGTIGQLQDFDSYNEFDQFLNEKLDSEFTEDDLDLVFLGDIFDFWQAIPESDLLQISSFPPTWNLDAIQLEVSSLGEQKKIREIVQKNKQFFRSLAHFLNGKPYRRAFFIPGNHDHSLVEKAVQEELTTLLASFGITNHQLMIGELYYENTSLQVYAEHGNQFDEDNRYSNFPGFAQGVATYQEDCKGYFFVRLFWNLLKTLDHSLENGPTHWYKVYAWLAKNRRLKLIPTAFKLFMGYKHHLKRFPRISLSERLINVLEVEEQGQKEEILLMVPENLFRDDEFDPDAVFSDNETVEEFYRKLYLHPGEEGIAMRNVVDELLQSKAQRFNIRCQVPPPVDLDGDLDREIGKINYSENIIVQPEDLAEGATRAIFRRDRDEVAVSKILTPGDHSSLKNTPFEHHPRYIIFGHTHKCVKKTLQGGEIYFNTGTWQNREDENGIKHKDLTYVLIHNKTESIYADLHHFVRW